jgi:hypothetical protein
MSSPKLMDLIFARITHVLLWVACVHVKCQIGAGDDPGRESEGAEQMGYRFRFSAGVRGSYELRSLRSSSEKPGGSHCLLNRDPSVIELPMHVNNHRYFYQRGYEDR